MAKSGPHNLNRRLFLSKVAQWLRAYVQEYGAAMKSLVSIYGLFGLASAAIILLMLNAWGVDSPTIVEEARNLLAGVIAALTVFCFWAFLNLFFCITRTNNRLSDEGVWIDERRFVFKTPKTVRIVMLKPEDTPICVPIEMSDIPKRALVALRTEFFRDNKFWNTSFSYSKNSFLDLKHGRVGRESGVMLPNDKTIYLHATKLRDDVTEEIVRVVLEYYTFQ